MKIFTLGFVCFTINCCEYSDNVKDAVKKSQKMDTPSKIAQRIFREKSKENRLQSDNINQIKETCPVIPVNI